MTISVRTALPSEMDALAALHRACFDVPWDARGFADLMCQPGTFAFIAQDGPDAAALILARAAAGESEILTLGTRPEARRSGYARTLVRGAADHAARLGAQTMFLEVAAGNAAARALYEGLGFTPAGYRKSYYTGAAGENADALILRVALPLTR